MIQQPSQNLTYILERRLESESQRWISALKSGFNVAVACTDKELKDVVESFIERRQHLKKHRTLHRVTDGRLNPLTDVPNSVPDEIDANSSGHDGGPQITVHWGEPKPGLAAVHFQLPSLLNLLPTPSTMILQILESTQLEKYLDAFDGKKMTQLKRILELGGPEYFFDSVIQVAYLSGFRGNEEESHRELERRLNHFEKSRQIGLLLGPGSASEQQTSAMGLIFEKLLALPDPHDVLKASLAFYVFHGRNLTQAEASKILKISRSTLQSHLQLAERLNVAEYFIPARKHA